MLFLDQNYDKRKLTLLTYVPSGEAGSKLEYRCLVECPLGRTKHH